VDLDEFSPVGGRATGERDWRRLERFAQMREDLPDRRWFGDECDQPDIAAAPRALERKLFPNPGHELGPSDPGSVVRARFVARVVAVAGGISACRMPADRMLSGRSISPLAGIPFCHVP
jgi:hypothetical protein